MSQGETFANYRRRSRQIASQLYGEEVADKIGKAKTESEICRILITARHNLPD